MNRREAREAAFQLLFAWGFHDGENAAEVCTMAAESAEVEPDVYIEEVTRGVAEHCAEIDAKIAAKAVGWRVERLSRASLAILRLAVYEMLYMDAIPTRVSLNEAIELSKRYGEDASPKFINGILHAISEEEGIHDKGAEPSEG